MSFSRSSGVLLHVSSLPGPYGVGDLGPEAHAWVDWLADARCRYWQTLPLGPTGYGDSPYSSLSSFAGNINLISPDLLVDDGLLVADEVDRKERSERVDYSRVIERKWAMVDLAFTRLTGDLKDEFNLFQQREAEWLEPYSLFMALKVAHGGGSWTGWSDELRNRDRKALDLARRELADEIDRHDMGQFIFYRQLDSLQEHAAERRVAIIGDVPLYVASDSVDVWLNPELFFVDMTTGKPTMVAGVPADAFSEMAQWWGNPLYRWDVHRADDYAWWARRLESFMRQADVLRIDHFTGFAMYYEIDGSAHSAEEGVWREGPGSAFFRSMERRFGELGIIVEDLGPLGDVVEDLRLELGYSGMKVLQEAFDGDLGNPSLPENYQEDFVVYTGTHDNDTARGRLDGERDQYREQALAYTGASPETYSWALIACAWESVAVIAITPMQTLLGLGTEARMNYPSTIEGNWQWRMTDGVATSDLGEKMSDLNLRTGRSR